jgi:transcriptional regulator with XRE-family HTH domain
MNEASMSGRIEALRVKLGFSQTDMGRELGVSAMSVSRYERGTNEPPRNVQKLNPIENTDLAAALSRMCSDMVGCPNAQNHGPVPVAARLRCRVDEPAATAHH